MLASTVCKTIHDIHISLWDFLGCRVRIATAVSGRTPCPNQTTALEKAIPGLPIILGTMA